MQTLSFLSLAEMLEHLEEGEISCDRVLVKCQVCACEEVRNYILEYKMNFCDSCFEDVASAV